MFVEDGSIEFKETLYFIKNLISKGGVDLNHRSTFSVFHELKTENSTYKGPFVVDVS